MAIDQLLVAAAVELVVLLVLADHPTGADRRKPSSLAAKDSQRAPSGGGRIEDVVGRAAPN